MNIAHVRHHRISWTRWQTIVITPQGRMTTFQGWMTARAARARLARFHGAPYGFSG